MNQRRLFFVLAFLIVRATGYPISRPGQNATAPENGTESYQPRRTTGSDPQDTGEGRDLQRGKRGWGTTPRGNSGWLGATSWGNSGWGTNSWGNSGWGTTGWAENQVSLYCHPMCGGSSPGWGTTGWGNSGWDTTGWGNSGWDTNGWGNSGWDTTGWRNSGWGTTPRGNSGWGTTPRGNSGWGTTDLQRGKRGWGTTPRGNSGWGTTPRGNSGWGTTPRGNSGWGTTPRGNSGWYTTSWGNSGWGTTGWGNSGSGEGTTCKLSPGCTKVELDCQFRGSARPFYVLVEEALKAPKPGENPKTLFKTSGPQRSPQWFLTENDNLNGLSRRYTCRAIDGKTNKVFTSNAVTVTSIQGQYARASDGRRLTGSRACVLAAVLLSCWVGLPTW